MTPSLRELLLGPFLGLAIYPRAAASRLRRPALLVLCAIGGVGLVLAASFHLRMGRTLHDLRDSQLWLMPRVRIADGLARVEAAPGRTLDAGPFWLVLDTSREQLASLPGPPGDRRPVVHVTRQALVVYRRDRGVATGYPWSGVEASLGPMDLDGPELLTYLGGYLTRLTAFLWLVVVSAVAAWQALLILLYVGLYRALFGRGLRAPGTKTLLVAASLAALPAVLGAGVLLLFGVAQTTVAAVHALLSGALFFAGATRLRLGDALPSAEASAAAPPPDGEVSP